MQRMLLNCVFGLILFSATNAQQGSPPEPTNVTNGLAHMQSDNLRTREAGFAELITGLTSGGDGQTAPSDTAEVLAGFLSRYPGQAEQVKVGLIQLLVEENGTFITNKKFPPGGYTESDSEYYAGVIDAVSSLNDERSIPALVGAMTTGGMAQRALLKYGDKALGPVLEQLKNPDALVRATALGMSIALLKRQNDTASHKRATDLVRSSLSDPDPVVRRHAVREIDCLYERKELVPILEKIAKTDPDKLPGRALDSGDAGEFYPVRYDARTVLRDIEDNKACAP